VGEGDLRHFSSFQFQVSSFEFRVLHCSGRADETRSHEDAKRHEELNLTTDEQGWIPMGCWAKTQ
jgi:hypothetical protein